MRPAWERLYRRLSSDESGPFWHGPVRGVLGAASRLYGLGAGAANLGYDLGLRGVRRLPVPVVGVGSVTVGGAGKTPLVMEVVRSLERLGLPAGVISRGYGGRRDREPLLVSWGDGPRADARQAGDEPVLMARRLRAPVAVCADRYQAGRLILEQCGPRVLVGDDLFQHRRLHRDLDLAVLDASAPLAGGRLLPRGRLRESPAGLRRAQAAVLTRADDPDQVRGTRQWLRGFWGNGPVLACRHRLEGLEDISGRSLAERETRGAAVVAFCGLARPGRFAESLAELGLEVRRLEPFADHHAFTSAEMEDLWRLAGRVGASALACSEKDQVRLPEALPGGARIWVTRLGLEFQGGVAELDRLLAWGLAGWRPA